MRMGAEGGGGRLCIALGHSDRIRGMPVSLALSLPSCEMRGLGVKS